MSRGKKDPNAVALSALFKGAPCAFLNTFQEAIGVAERLAEGCHIVWLWTGFRLRPDQNYRVCRQPTLAMSQRENEHGSYVLRVWENGITEVPEIEHKKLQGEFLQRDDSPKAPEPPKKEIPAPAAPRPETIRDKAAKTCQKIDTAIGVSIFDVIEQLKKVGLTAEKILEVVAGLSPKQ